MTMTLQQQFKEFNQYSKQQLSSWFQHSLDRAVQRGDVADTAHSLISSITAQLAQYSSSHGVQRVVVGLSGGIDSALTAAVFKAAGWDVVGVTLPIKQNPLETVRAREVAHSLGIPCEQYDLSRAAEQLSSEFHRLGIDTGLQGYHTAERIRNGNTRARLRMITLYNIASQRAAVVASTDNFSEWSTGFWTLHGDVGDLAPLQSLTKSWEIPLLARAMSLPLSVIQAAPTDGLGISRDDAAQLGFDYAHLDLVLLDLLRGQLTEHIDSADSDELRIIHSVQKRIRDSAFKRSNPTNLLHPVCKEWRYTALREAPLCRV